MELVIFAVTALLAITGAVAMVVSKNAVHSALFLLLNFGAIAVLYLMLYSPFLFVIQLIVYAGAILVLFLFVVMLLGAENDETQSDALRRTTPVAVGFGIVLIGLMVAVALRGANTPVVTTAPDFGNSLAIAQTLFTTYLLPFEITAMVILAAIIGVVVLHIQEKRTA